MKKAKYLPHKKWAALLKKMPMLTVDPVIVKDGKVLLIERPGQPYKGFWTLPGGFVGYGETLEQAAEREAAEETGLKTRAVKFVGIYDNPRRDPRGNIITAAFTMKITGGKIRATPEAKRAEFFPLEKLPKNIGFDHRRIVKDALKIYAGSKRKY